jgi:hypothetical protein
VSLDTLRYILAGSNGGQSPGSAGFVLTPKGKQHQQQQQQQTYNSPLLCLRLTFRLCFLAQ